MLPDSHPGDDPPANALGEILRAARQRKGLSMRRFAAQLGRTHGTVANWETGYARPSVTKRAEMARILDIPVSELFPEVAGARQVTVTDPQTLLLLQAFEQVPAAQRETLLAIVLGAADRLAAVKD